MSNTEKPGGFTGTLMKLNEIANRAESLVKKYRVTRGKQFRLRDVNPDDTENFTSKDKPRAQEALAAGVDALCKLQDMLFAQDRWAVLLIFQAMDAAGKDSAIKHVMSGINPQGCHVVSFKAPSAEELDHDYLWRCVKQLPERGRIGVFNRSYYEETIVVRVHPEFLKSQKLPPQLVTTDIWDDRFRDIRNFERYLTGNGVAVCKFFLHVSKAEQRKRFLARLDDPAKNWKFSANDVKESGHWDKYMKAYEQTVRNTATDYAPWYVVPADHKWFTRLVVASAVISTLSSLELAYPKASVGNLKELEAAKQALLGNGSRKHKST